ncbi:MAG: LysR family transcriptional regulator [Lachnospiraceae bacterium]|nr:LysR family transcriptional regulator [Lachnospiraceae bacterium]
MNTTQNLSLYRIFYVTALTGNISKAADQLFISQPAISRSIQKLEQSLGLPLFTRNSRGVSLTEDGALLFSHVKVAFQSLEAAENQLRLHRELGVSHLRIGVSSTLCKYVLLPHLKDFIRLHPHIQITIACQSTNHTLKMLETGDLDMGLTGKPDKLHQLSFYPIQKIQDTFAASREYLENLCCLLSLSKHQFASSLSPFALPKKVGQENGSYGSLTKTFLKSGSLMLLDKNNLTRQYLDQYLREQNLTPENILEATSLDLLIDFAKTGLGIACVIREFIQKELEEESLLELPLPVPIPPREVGFVCQKGPAQKEAVKKLISFTIP